MSQTAQDKNSNIGAGFTTFQAYALAVITLAIGIAVGYFARGSAPRHMARKPLRRRSRSGQRRRPVWALRRGSYPVSAQPSNSRHPRRRCSPKPRSPCCAA